MVGLAGWIGLVFLGVALLWVVQITIRGAGTPNDSRLVSGLTVASWLLIFLGIAGPISASGGLVLALFGLFFLRMSVHRFREAEYLSLLWLLGVSVRNGMPLADVVRSFASERCDQVGVRCERFATLLERGESLPDAMKHARINVPIEAWLASEFRGDPAIMGATMQDAARQSTQLVPELNAAMHRMMYLLTISIFAILMMTFVFVKIVPTVNQILMDFDLEIPAALDWMISFGGLVSRYILFWVPAIWLLGSMFILLLLSHMGIRMEPPFLRPITRGLHSAILMRALATQMKYGKSLSRALGLLAEKYPTRYIRDRLSRVEDEVAKGNNWTGSLVDNRLLGQAEASVLNAAQRTGNLTWALEEMADTATRRMQDRISLFVRMAMPIVVLIVALPVASLGIGLFVTLVELIEATAYAN